MLSFTKTKPAPAPSKSLGKSLAKPVDKNAAAEKKWWIKGKATHDAVEQEAKEQQERYENSKRAFRFFLGMDEEALLTFVDGDLDENGLLDALSYKNHVVKLGANKFENYICTAHIEPCPICEDNSHPTLVSAFTVIDHREFQTKKGETVKWSKKLFLAKKNTFKLLQKIASKHGGLSGATLEVLRTGGENAPSVGSYFDFVKKDSLIELKKHFVRKDKETGKLYTEFEPFDYEKELVYRTADELRALGFGSGVKPIGSEGKSAKEKFDSEV